MKYFDIDWAGALEGLAAWTALPLPARRAALAEVQPGAGAAASSLGDELDALLAAGFVEWAPKGRRVAPPPHLRPLVVALRAMKRRGVWEAPTPAALVGYLDEHFTVQETQCLLRTRGFADGGHARRHLAEAASSEEWLEEFLAADTPDRALAWERARMTGYETQPRLADPEAGRATRELVRALLALPEPVPLAELVRHLPGASAETVGAALHAGLRYLLLFAALRADDLEPVVGPWPEAVRRLRGAEALPPPPDAVEVVEELECAWLLEDMTTVLVAAAGEPLRVRGSDMALFARAQDAVAARLPALPEWAEEAAGTDGVAGWRTRRAC